MMIWRGFLFWVFSASLAFGGAVRIKDLVEFDGVRGNDLVGWLWSGRGAEWHR